MNEGNAERLNLAVSAAVGAGVLPASATPQRDEEPRPWPVVLLTALGAWLAAVPLLIVVGLLLGDLISRSAGPYVVGLLVLAGAAVVLRARTVPLFVEQLAVPALLVGAGSLGFGVFRDLPERAGALLLAAVALALALVVPRAWLRVLLGAAMAGLAGFALLGPRAVLFGQQGIGDAWLACHALVLLGLAAPWLQGRLPRAGALLETLSAGWLLTTLAWLAWLAGATFLVGGAAGGLASEVVREVSSVAAYPRAAGWAMAAASALLAAGGAVQLARAWPVLRQPALAAGALVMVGLAALLPTLGGALVLMATLLLAHRWRLAAAAALAVAWVLGSFYYQLTWTLAHKALLLVLAGAVLGALAWWLMRQPAARDAAPAPPQRLGRGAVWLAGATLATLGVAAVGIWQKQDVIARGQPVFVDLAPVDPRSLMQGDYMRLNFRLPAGVSKIAPPGLAVPRPRVVAQRDERGIARLLRPAEAGAVAASLAPGEFFIELTPRNGNWVLVTDAWFFREGEGERWARARFGEFRVAPDGRALLVGMADADLKPILP